MAIVVLCAKSIRSSPSKVLIREVFSIIGSSKLATFIKPTATGVAQLTSVKTVNENYCKPTYKMT